MRTDVADIKLDVRSLRDKLDAVSAKIESVKDSIAKAQIWALMLYIALAAGLLSVLARGFGWI